MIPESTSPKSVYTGNDVAFEFDFDFRALKNADVLVSVVVGVAPAVELELNVDYTLTFRNFPNLGGSITLIEAGQSWMEGAALKLNAVLTIEYVVAPSQLSNLRGIPANLLGIEVEKSLDKLAMDIAGLKDQVDDVESTDESGSFPDLAGNANKLVRVNATEDGFEYGPEAQDILDAATQATAASEAASESEDNAANSASAASASASSAASSASSALTTKAQVEVSVAQAAGHAVDAENSATASAASASAASTSATNAGNFADEAEDWADESERWANLLVFTSIVNLTFADSPYQVLNTDKGKLFRIDTTGGDFEFRLPTMQADETWRVSAVKTDMSLNEITVVPYAADTIDGGSSDTISDMSYGQTFYRNMFSDWTSRIFIDASSAVSSGGGGLDITAVQNIASNGTIIPGSAIQQALKVQGNGGPQSANIVPFSANPSDDGTIIVLIGQDDSKILTITHNDSANGCMLKGNCYLGQNDTLGLMWDSTASRYIELFRSVD